MVLGLENIQGLGFLKDFDIAKFASGTGTLVLALIMLALSAGVVGYWLWRRSEKEKYNKHIFWFEEVHGEMVPIGEDLACELTIPNTNVTVFFVKKKNLYIPRPTMRMGKDSYWFAIRNNRELVNFKMKNLNKEMKESNLEYDHTDMRYAKENLLELIKRNYRDKNLPWWKEYKDLISTIVYVFVTALALYFLLSKIGKLIGQVDTMMKSAKDYADSYIALKKSSGVTTEWILALLS